MVRAEPQELAGTLATTTSDISRSGRRRSRRRRRRRGGLRSTDPEEGEGREASDPGPSSPTSLAPRRRPWL
jgi:hypothetical protein